LSTNPSDLTGLRIASPWEDCMSVVRCRLRFALNLTIPAVLLVLNVGRADAQVQHPVYTWNATASSTWTTTTNWSGGSAPIGTGGAGSELVFDIAAYTATDNLGTQYVANSILFANSAAGAAVIAASGGSGITLSGNDASITNFNGTANATVTVSVPLTLSSNTTILTNAVSGSLLTISGGIATTSTANLNFLGGGNVALSTAAVTGGGGITMNGTGTVTLSVANSYSGNTVINSGILKFGAAGALPSGTTLTINSGGTASYAYAFTNADLAQIASGSSGVVALAAANSNPLSFASLPNVSLGANGANTYSGMLTPYSNSGTTSTFNLGGGGSNLTVTSVLANLAGTTSSLFVSTNGAATASVILNALETFTGNTTVNSGVLSLSFAGLGSGTTVSNVITSGSALTLGGGSLPTTLNITGKASNTVTSSQAFNGLTLLPGASAITGALNGGLALDVALGAIAAPAVGATIDFATSTLGTGSITTTTANTASTILGGWATAGGGAMWAVSAGTGSVAGNISGLATGLGSLSSGGDVDVPASASATVATINSLRFTNTSTATTVTLTSGLTITSGGILIPSTVTSATAISGGSLTAGNAGSLSPSTTAELVVMQNAPAADTLTIGSSITNNSSTPIALVKSGTGTLILTGVNTYTGGTYVNAGTLQIGSGNLLGSLPGNVVNNGTLNFNTIANTPNVYSGSISGVGSVGGLNGASGGVTLTGTSTYTGITSFTNTTLTVAVLANGGQPSSIGASSNLATNLSFGNAQTFQFIGAATSTDRLFTIGVGTGTTTVTITNLGTGALDFSNTGAIYLASGAGTGRQLTLAGNYVSTNDATSTYNVFAPLLADASPTAPVIIIKSGASTWELTNLNTYTGTTTISGGVLAVNTLALGGFSSSIGASSNAASNLLFSGGGALQYVGTGAATTDRLFTLSNAAGGALDASGGGALDFINNGSIVASAATTLTLTGTSTANNALASIIANNSGTALTALTKTGVGTWVLAAPNTYTGATTVNMGTLTLDFSNTLETSGNAPAANIIAATSALVLGGGTLNLNGNASAANSQTFASLTLNAGASAISLIGAAGGSMGLTFTTAAWTRNIGGTVNFTTSGTTTLTGSPTLVNNVIGGYAAFNGVDWATIVSGSVAGLSSGAGYNTDTYSSTSNTDYTSASAVPTSAFTTYSLRMNTFSATSLVLPAGINVIASGGLLVTSNLTAATTISNGALAAGAVNAGTDLVVQQFSSGNLTINSVITNSGGQGTAATTDVTSLTKAGTGALILTAVNAYTGANTIGAGSVTVNAGSNLGFGGALNSGALAGAPQTLTNNGTLNLNNGYQVVGSLTGSVTGVINLGNGTTLNVLNSGNGVATTYAGNITGSGGSLVMNTYDIYDSALTLSGSNSFTGGATVGGAGQGIGTAINTLYRGGVLIFAAPSALPSTGSLTANFGGTISFGYGLSQAVLNRFTTGSNGVVALSVNDALNLDFSSATGANLANLSLGANTASTFSGTLTPYGNTYRLGGGGAVLTVASVLSDVGGATSLVVDRNGSAANGGVTLVGANTYSGSTTVNSLTLTLTFSTVNQAGGVLYNGVTAGALTLGGGNAVNTGGALTLTAATGTNNQSFSTLTLGAGTNDTLTLTNGTAGNILNVNLGSITRNAGSTLNISTLATTGTTTLTTTSGTANSILTDANGAAYAVVGGTDWAVKASATNAVTIPGNGATTAVYTANTWSSGTNTNVTSSFGSVSGATNSLRFNTAAATVVTLTGSASISTGGILVGSTVAGHTSQIAGSFNLSGPSGGELVIFQNATAGATGLLTIAANLVDGGASPTGLTLTGAGSTTLTGTNTYTGATTLLSGTLTFNPTTGNGLSGAGDIVVNNGAVLTFSGTGVTSSGRILDNSSGAGTWGGVNLGSTLYRTISGSGNIISNGGTLVAANAYTGGTEANGNLTVALGGSAGSGDLVFTSNSIMVVFNNSGAQNIGNLVATNENSHILLNNNTVLNITQTLETGSSNSISGTGGLVLNANSTGMLILAANGAAFFDDYAGGTQVLGGTLFVASSAIAGLNGNLTVNSNLLLSNSAQSAKNLTGSSAGFINQLTTNTLTITQTTNTTYAGVITGGGSLVLASPSTGTLTLSGANTYVGATTVSGGLTLNYSSVGSNVLYGAAGYAGAAGLTLTGGTLTLIGQSNSASTQSTLGNLTLGAGASEIDLLPQGSGTMALTLGGTWAPAAHGSTILITTPNSSTGTLSSNPALTNNIIGGYATFGTAVGVATDFATVVGGQVIALGNTGAGAAGYNTDTYSAGSNTDVTALNPSQSAITINSLRFNVAQANTLTLSGTNVITSGGLLVTGNVGNNLTTITGGTLEGASGGDLIVHQYNTANALVISSIVANDGAATALTKAGPGLLTLTNNNNSYTGGTFISGGTLGISNNAQLGGASGGVTVTNGAALTITSTLALSSTRTITLGAGGGTLNASNNTLSFASAGTINGNSNPLTLTDGGAGGVINFNTSAFSNAGNITVAGSVAATLNTITTAGPITIINNSSNGSGLVLGGTITPTGTAGTPTFVVTIGGTGNTTLSGSLAQSTSIAGLTMAGSGTLTVSGAANSYTGFTTVDSGSLVLNYTTAGTNLLAAASGTAGGLTLGGTIQFLGKSGTATAQANSLGSLGVLSGASSLILTPQGSGAATMAVTIGNVWSRQPGGTLNITLQNVGAGSTLTSSPALFNGIVAGWVTIGTTATGATAGTDFATVVGGNVVPLTGNGGYNVDTYASTSNTDVQASIGTGTATINSLRFNTTSASAFTLTGTLTISTGGLLDTGNASNNLTTITGGTLIGQAGYDLVVNQYNTTNSLTIASTIADNPLSIANNGNTATGLTKTGPGTLNLTGNNTYTGPTFVNAGILAINGTQSTATGAVTVSNGAILEGSGTIGGAVTVNPGGTIKGGNSPGTLNLVGNLALSPPSNGLSSTIQIDFTNAGASTSLLNLTGSGGLFLPVGFNIKLNGDGSDAPGTTYMIPVASVASGNIQLNGSAFTGTVPAADFTLNTVGFANSISSYSLTAGSNSLVLSLTTSGTPTPESRCLLLTCAGVMGIGLGIRRRQRASGRAFLTTSQIA
jgi:fibronectin-binding autotransporter adhesin